MRDTSIKAYNSIKDNGLITGRRMEVYTCLYQFGPLTASQVFQKTGLKTNQSGRFTELKEMGVITEKGRVTCPVTKSEAILWDVTDKVPSHVEKKPTRKDKKKEILKMIESIGKQMQEPLREEMRKVYCDVKAL